MNMFNPPRDPANSLDLSELSQKVSRSALSSSGFIREISPEDLRGVMSLRQKCFFAEASDTRYLGGGIPDWMDESSVLHIHKNEPTSRYLFVRSQTDELMAYARISLLSKPPSVFSFLRNSDHARSIHSDIKLHVLIVDESIRGKNVAIDNEAQPAAEFIFRKACDYGRQNSCAKLVGAIATAPVPNEASLKFSKRMGMKLVSSAQSVWREGAEITFGYFELPLGKGSR